jgi:7-cyano-7-deazaguanine reductase
MQTPLGKPTRYGDKYNSDLLVAIPRSLNRNEINIKEPLPFYGIDFWNCYELSWLDQKGKPCVRVLQLEIPASSEFLIESKSLKLYLNSFNGTSFVSQDEVRDIIEKDIRSKVQGSAKAKIFTLNEYSKIAFSRFDGNSIDDLEIEVSDYIVNSSLLKLCNSGEYKEEVIFSELLKSNCLITEQPDWASVQISYKGKKIDHESLLRYIVSFRNHNEFHEQCVERIFYDIMDKCRPDSLQVFAKYTRRGGIDINPLRSTENITQLEAYKTRDIRQ